MNRNRSRKATWIACFTLLLLAVGLVGCVAARRTDNPEVRPETLAAINIGQVLSDLERDYRKTFTDLGELIRSGRVTREEAEPLFAAGRRFRTVYEQAVGLFVAWQQNPNATIPEQLYDLVAQARTILLSIVLPVPQATVVGAVELAAISPGLLVWLAFAISGAIARRLSEDPRYQNLTQAEAEALVKKFTEDLPRRLPSPEELAGL
jgi:hypothetical protein